MKHILYLLDENNINEYITKYNHKNDLHSDLYLGYVVHLLTDELFNITVRERFVQAMIKEGIDQNEREFFYRIIRDIENVDRMLVKKYPFKHGPCANLEAVWHYEIKDYIGVYEIDASKRWVIDTFFKGEHDSVNTLYYSYDDAVGFIHYAVNNIIDRLSNGRDFSKIL